MSVRTVRTRMLIVCAAVLVIGVELTASVFYVTSVLNNQLGWCTLDDAKAGGLCGWYDTSSAFRGQLILAGLAVLLLAAFPLLAAWCLRPVAELVPVVAQLGPQNLGFRIRAGARGGKDPVAALASELDEMMDRIATGYEGQRRFAANASHELRTPLAVQRTLIEVGMAQSLTADQTALLTAQLLQTNERNERLIEGLLVLSEADQGLVASLPHRLDEIAAGVIATHQAWAAEATVRVTADLRPRVVHGEDVLLERLVTNLLQNALKYNHPGGSIHVTVGGSPALSVINTGQVVPVPAVSGLFEPFKRLASDRIGHSGGAGLGLTIARSITQAHGGTIAAEPASGGGLQVTVQLPADGAHTGI
jgi:signal transduction histidine kinase